MDRAAWFDTPRIESTVTRHFVCSQLLPDEVEQLDRPLAFGDGLTDCTYWEWIQGKAKRLFLVLVDLDLADQIFGVVDDSWEDEDLPIALDQVERLSLTATKDPKTEREFYQRQFHYLLRPLEKGQHVDYQDHELVPLDVHEKRPGLTHSHDVDRVGLPNHPGKVFCRRRFPVGPEPGCLPHEDFMLEISSVEGLQHEHVVSYWASYTHHGHGYVLFAPAGEYRLSSYLANTPSPLKPLDKLARRRVALDWIHCLVETLCFLHSRGLALGNIRPSTVFLTHGNHIFLSPASPLNPDTSGLGNSFDKEAYDYDAPEKRSKPSRQVAAAVTAAAAAASAKGRAPGPSSSRGSAAPSIRSGRSGHSGHGHGHGHEPASPPPSSSSLSAPLPPPVIVLAPRRAAPAPDADPLAADVFSAGCVALELLSHGLLGRSAGSFAAHRGARHKAAGRGGAVPDSSFHRNLGQVEGWMAGLAKDAAKKVPRGGGDGRNNKGEGVEEQLEVRIARGVAPLLHVVDRMLSSHPEARPSASDVREAMHQIYSGVIGIPQPNCCTRWCDSDNEHEQGGGAGEDTSSGSGSGHGHKLHHEQGGDPHHGGEANGAASPNAVTKRNSSGLRSLVGLGHRRNNSDDSSRSKSSSNQSQGERREMSGALKAIQHLRLSKS